MLVFLFTDIEGSTRLWEEHTGVMRAVIARHDEILRELVERHGGRITKHTGDGITAVFETGQPLACALQAQLRFAAEPWGEIGALPIRAGLHAGEAEWIAGPMPERAAQQHTGDYFGPPVNCTARVMSAAWGGQILLTPEVTQASPLPDQAALVDLGQHLLKNVSAPKQLYQLDHPQLPRHQFPPPRTLSGQSIRQAVDQRGGQLAGMEPQAMCIALVATTLVPALQGELDPESGALAGNLGVLEDLSALSLRGFVAAFAARLRAGPMPAPELQVLLQDELQARWQAGDETALALRRDASRLLQAVHGVEAAMMAASAEVKETLARGLVDLGQQFGEFRWMLAGVQDTLAEMRSVQERHLALTEEILALHKEQAQVSIPATAEAREVEPRRPAFLEDGAPDLDHRPVFVARERELAWLEDRLDAALTGQGGVVFVTGGPGRGKTALLNEFARRAMEANPDLLVANGSCNAFTGVGDPYLPFREVMAMLSGDVEARWLAGQITMQHAQRLWSAVPLLAQALLARGPDALGVFLHAEDLLARAATASGADAPWFAALRQTIQRRQALPPGITMQRVEQSHLFEQYTNVLRRIGESHPLLLILDDVQWADSASIGLLFHLGRRLQAMPVVLACAYRPEEVALGRNGERHPLEKVLTELKRQFGDVWVDLGREDKVEGRGFVDALLDTEPNELGEGFRSALFEHTGGHPLFAIELLRAMQERGDLVQDQAGCWVEGGSLDWGTLPARVEAVMEERIGRLEEGLREILTVASVEGEEFTAQVVGRVQKTGERKMLQALSRQLERRYRLVRGQGEEQVGRQRLSRYRFAHALFQQYLYNDLSPGECRLLHEEIASVLEELYAGQTEAIAVQLARHYGQAGDDVRTLQYETLAADAALDAYANREAEVHYRRALELAPTEAQRAHLLAGLGEALRRLGRFEEALQALREGVRIYQALEDLDGVAGLYSRLARATWWTGDHAGALRLCEEGLEAVAGASESREQAQLLHEAARAFHFACLPEKARLLCQRALDMAERLGAVDVEADALATWGVLPGNAQEGLKTLERAAELAEEAGFLDLAGRAHTNLGSLWFNLRGDIRAARQHTVRSIVLAQQTGDIAKEIFARSNAIDNTACMGNLGEAAAHLVRMRRLADELYDPAEASSEASSAIASSAANIRWYRGDWAAAARSGRESLPEKRRLGDLQGEAGASRQLAEALLEAHFAARESSVHELAEAERALTRALEIHETWGDTLSNIECRCLLSALLASLGRLEEARSYLERIRPLVKQRPQTLFEAVFLWAEGGLAMAEERLLEAEAAFETMVGLYDRLGLRWWWARGLIDWAEALTAGGEPADLQQAETLLRQSLIAFEEMGAPGYASVARDRLEALEAAS